MTFVAVQVATAWSFGSYVLRDNGDTMQQRAVTWARDHRLGWLVDRAEEYLYSTPPSRTPAGRLSLGQLSAWCRRQRLRCARRPPQRR